MRVPRPRKPRTWRCRWIPAAAMAILLLAACSDDPVPSWRGGRPNILLISIDTLRADHLGIYGYERDTSPRLDALATSSVVYRNAYSPTPWTLPSHAAMLTGTHPYLMSMNDRTSAVPESAPRLASLLAAEDYQTAAFVDSAPRDYVGAERGFAIGFDTYEHSRATVRKKSSVYSIEETVDRATSWLSGRDPQRPFFLFLHTKAVHSASANALTDEDYLLPYDCPRPWRFQFTEQAIVEAALGVDRLKAEGGTNYLTSINAEIRAENESIAVEIAPEVTQAIIDLYDGCIAAVDAQLGRLFETLRRDGLLDETLIIVTADHGESFLEHRLFLHGQTYESLLHIPLLIRFPKWQPGIEITTPVELMDIAPTIAAVLDLSVEGMTGRILAGLPGEPEVPARNHFAYYLRVAEKPEGGQYALRSKDLRLVLNPPRNDIAGERELFQLESSKETEVELDDARLPSLESQLRSTLRAPALYTEAGVAEDDATREHLRALGYVD